jgi:hypothetical protein
LSKLYEKIQNDLKQAMLARDEQKLSSLRLLKSAIKNFEIELKGKPVLDENVQTIIQKQIKQRHDSIREYEKAGRAELADKERKEAVFFESLLPAQMSDADLADVIQKVIRENGMSSKKDFGKAMKTIQELIQGKADNRRISEGLNKVLQ